MKRIHIAIFTLLALTFVCCTSHEDELVLVPPTSTDSTIVEPEDTLVIDESLCTVTMPKIQFEGDDEFATRSSIAFDYLANPKVMKFSWKFGEDQIGVFPILNEETDQHPFVIKEYTQSNSSAAIGTFGINDQGVSVRFDGQYASYFPFKTETYKFSRNAIPVSYLGQVQKANVDIQQYYYIKGNPSASKAKYLTSEIAANAHLGAYDYLVSEATSTTSGALHFKYSRMGSVVRFFILVPDNSFTYDELQLVNDNVKFMQTGTMSIQDKPFIAETSSSNTMTMHFGEYNSETQTYSGFDFSNKTNNSSYYRDAERGYIIAYMFLAPIDLSTSTNCYLYLIGRDNDGNRHYFKSSGLTKLNLQANYFYQWVPSSMDQEITFSPITVQEWAEGNGWTNGDDGKGTQSW